MSHFNLKETSVFFQRGILPRNVAVLALWIMLTALTTSSEEIQGVSQESFQIQYYLSLTERKYCQ